MVRAALSLALLGALLISPAARADDWIYDPNWVVLGNEWQLPQPGYCTGQKMKQRMTIAPGPVLGALEWLGKDPPYDAAIVKAENAALADAEQRKAGKKGFKGVAVCNGGVIVPFPKQHYDNLEKAAAVSTQIGVPVASTTGYATPSTVMEALATINSSVAAIKDYQTTEIANLKKTVNTVISNIAQFPSEATKNSIVVSVSGILDQRIEAAREKTKEDIEAAKAALRDRIIGELCAKKAITKESGLCGNP
jgi:hypothetical protein